MLGAGRKLQGIKVRERHLDVFLRKIVKNQMMRVMAIIALQLDHLGKDPSLHNYRRDVNNLSCLVDQDITRKL